MKYIIFKGRDHIPTPVIFPDHIDHADMAIAIKEEFLTLEPVSAGQISFPLEAIDNVFLHGASQSLGMKPDELNDERIVKCVLKQQQLI